MTPTPFAGVPTLRDAARSSSPDRMSATGGLASPGQPAFSSPPPGYLDESKVCVYCDATYYRFTKTPQRIWERRTHCADRKCTSKGDKARAALRPPPQGGPKDMGREAILFAGLSFADDPRAARPEIRFTKLPEPTISLTGSHGQMCASARRT
jgi:hypothetical protein